MSKKTGKTKDESAEEEVTEEETEETTEDTEEESEEEEEESAEESEEETEEESEEESDDDSEEEEESDSSSSSDELDIDAELERENQGADPDKAKKGFKERDKKRKGEDGKPVTEARLQEILAEDRKDRQRDAALVIAKGMAGSDKEAELIVAKWANRTFPKHLSLREQIQEAYAITHSKKLIGERNEALRALKGKKGVKKDAAGTHRDAAAGAAGEPKLPPGDAEAIRVAGFKWNLKTRQYEKKLANGRLLVRDPKTHQVKLMPKA